MAHETLAPWAEVVPGAPYPMSGQQAMEWSERDEQWKYELVDGRLVRMPMSGGEASRSAIRLAAALLVYVDSHGLGAVLGADMAFDLTQPADANETLLSPDVAFVRLDRIPSESSPEYLRAWKLAPDLMAEIASPNQYRPEMTTKMQRWMAAGVRLGWLVWPKARQVEIWRAGNTQPESTLSAGDALDGLDVLPGFSYPLARLFGV